MTGNRDDTEPAAASGEATERARQSAARTSGATGEAGGEAPAAQHSAETAEPAVRVVAHQDAGTRIGQRRTRLAQRPGLSLAATDAGYYMDVQEAQLRQELHGEGAGIFRQGNSIAVRIAGTVAFATGSSELSPEVEPTLETIARVFKEYGKTLIVVHSHTDAAGDDDFNQALSEARALAVARHLLDQGLEPERVIAVGHGESQPVQESGAPASGWPDRRIEIEVQLIVEETG